MKMKLKSMSGTKPRAARLPAGFLASVLGSAGLCGVSPGAIAGPVTAAGESIGLALGTPLPEGAYFIDTGIFVAIPSQPKVDVLINIPVLAYSSPWKALGGRVFGYAALPEAAIGIEKSTWIRSLYNSAGFVGLAWDLGGGWGFSDVVGGYAPIKSDIGAILGGNFWTFNNRAAISYATNDWNLTAHVIYGTSGHDRATHIQTQNDYLNVDLTAIKSFGKWQAGVVGYNSADLSTATRNKASGKQSQFALGGLVGYNFGPVSMQMYMTRDVSEKNIGADSNRLSVRLVAPL